MQQFTVDKADNCIFPSLFRSQPPDRMDHLPEQAEWWNKAFPKKSVEGEKGF